MWQAAEAPLDSFIVVLLCSARFGLPAETVSLVAGLRGAEVMPGIKKTLKKPAAAKSTALRKCPQDSTHFVQQPFNLCDFLDDLRKHMGWAPVPGKNMHIATGCSGLGPYTCPDGETHCVFVALRPPN